MQRTSARKGQPVRRTTGAAALAALVLAGALAGCSSTSSAPTTTTSASGGSSSAIPAAAFKDTTGVTPSTVTVGNISTLFAGLFKGALIGTQAYAAYVNSTGGIHGRKLVVDSYDDGYQGAPNKQGTQAAVDKDFATVGGFSLQDSFGGTVLAANPGVPNVTVPLDQATADLPNTFSPDPPVPGWSLGALTWFKQHYPQDITKTGTLIADQPSSVTKWGWQKQAMESIGYKVAYEKAFDITQTDFTQNVVAMRQAGVKILFVEQMPQNYAAAVVKALDQQSYHPIVVFGAGAYSDQLVPNSGGAAAAEGLYFEMPNALFLGEDAKTIPAAGTFVTWMQKTAPGFQPDLFSLFGWLSAQLFAQALAAAGADPTRGSVLQALHKVTSFDGNGLFATSNPAAKQPPSCFVLARITNGAIVRYQDPPLSGSDKGYICNAPFYRVPKGKG
jgi:ABC-type branched-subunit amino acid transport system substrate-binding protein